MNCREIKQFSSDYLDRRLRPEEAALFEEHLRACAACKQEVDSLQETISLVGSLGTVETSPDFLAQVRRKIEKKARVRSLRHRLFEPMRFKLPLEAAALLLLGIGALHLYYRLPGLYRESYAPRPTVELMEKAAEPAGPGEPADKKSEMEQSPATPVPPAGSRAERKLSREDERPSRDREILRDSPKKEEALGKIARNDEKDHVHEVRAEDVSASRETVRQLVAEAGGQIVAEARSGRGFWLTVEVRQSHKEQLVSALKDPAKMDPATARSRLKSSAEGRPAREPAAETDALRAGQAASASKPAAAVDEPRVTLRIHITPRE